jgi:hypothetical protein
MGEDIRRMLHECIGEAIEIKTKKDEKICGKLSWLSPDRCMAEITLKNGQIETVTDVRIKTIRKLVK